MQVYEGRYVPKPLVLYPNSSPFDTHSLQQWPLCRLCKALLKKFHAWPSREWNLCSELSGTRSDFDRVTKKTSVSCPLCHCMRHLLPADLPQSTEILGILSYHDSNSHDVPAVLEMRADRERLLGHVQIGLLDVAQHYEPAPTLNFREISRLLRQCEEQHLHHDWSLPRYHSTTRIQLIDVADMMIISATTQRRYLALSYVWGGHDSFAATTKSRKSLRRKTGLHQHMNRIPQTIRDAMDVVRKLGERYLWVDRLCIEQDNATQKEAHIEKMDVIYSHALLTLIAHAGVAATSPLPGLRPGTRLTLPMKRLGDVAMSVLPPNLWESGAPHETRGWTLQEQLMSKRCLYFDYHTTWFQCDKGVCREVDATKNRPHEFMQPPASFNMRILQPDLAEVTDDCRFDNIWKQYATIIERYRTRELRHAEDTVHAIQGIARVIADSLHVQLISGVPSSMVPRALQFYLKDHSHMSRNEAEPSWSWAGWKESIFFDDENRAEPVSIDAVQLEMKFQYKAHTFVKAAIHGAVQPTGSKVIDLVEKPFARAPLYTLLDIECSSTRASAFKIGSSSILVGRRSGLGISLMFHIHDQGGTRCGYGLGRQPPHLKQEYYSDNLQWILVSKSQPSQVSLR